MELKQFNTLVLNASYEPLSVVNGEAAVKMWYADTAVIVEEYDQVVHSAYLEIRVPAVIRLKEYVSKPIKPVKFSRASVYARDEYRCQYCLAHCDTNELTYDHVIPRAQGGQTVWTNIVSCCYDCNSKKGGRTPQQARMKLNKQPVRPKAVPQMQFAFLGKSVPEQWRDFIYWEGELKSDEISQES